MLAKSWARIELWTESRRDENLAWKDQAFNFYYLIWFVNTQGSAELRFFLKGAFWTSSRVMACYQFDRQLLYGNFFKLPAYV
jgi:hypothetical protein